MAKKLKTKVDLEAQVPVHCAKCKTKYHRHRKLIGKSEKCGVCLNDATLVEGHPEKKKTTVKRVTAVKAKKKSGR